MSGVAGTARQVSQAPPGMHVPENPRRTTFTFFPPVDDAAAWHLDLRRMADMVLRSFPGASAEPEGALGPRPADSLSFEIPLGDGVWLEGLATSPFPGLGSVMARMASAEEPAVLDLVFFTSELALNRGDDEYHRIPPHAERDEITRVLQEHLDHADRP